MDFLINFITSHVTHSIAFAIAIGIIVSLDVYGLTLSQYEEFTQGTGSNSTTPKDPKQHAKLHASVHAILFLFYMLIVTMLVSSFKWIISRISGLIELFINYVLSNFRFPFTISINNAILEKSTILLLGLAIIYVVWSTYSSKIAEKHSLKITDPSDPLKDQRIDIKLIYRFIKFTNIRSSYLNISANNMLDIALSLAVAVDMLAVSAFIRVYFDGTLDSRYDGWHVDFWSWSALPATDGWLWFANVVTFTLIIYAVVRILALRAAKQAATITMNRGDFRLFGLNWGRANAFFHNRFGGYANFRLLFLRFSEPLFVFFVLGWALYHLLEAPEQMPPFYFQFFCQILLSVCLWICLIRVHGMKRIWVNVVRGIIPKNPAVISADGQQVAIVGVPRWYVLKSVVKSYFHAPFIIIFIALSIIIFAASHGVRTTEPLVTWVNMMSLLIGICTFMILYFPKGFPDLEAHLERRYFSGLNSLMRRNRNRYTMATFLAFCGILYFLHIVFRYEQVDDLWPSPTEHFISGIFWLLVLMFGASFLTRFRRHRNQKCCWQSENSSAFTKYEVTIGDWLTSLGMICFIWQFIILFSALTKG